MALKILETAKEKSLQPDVYSDLTFHANAHHGNKKIRNRFLFCHTFFFFWGGFCGKKTAWRSVFLFLRMILDVIFALDPWDHTGTMTLVEICDKILLTYMKPSTSWGKLPTTSTGFLAGFLVAINSILTNAKNSLLEREVTWDPPNGKFRKSSTQTCLGNLSPSLS